MHIELTDAFRRAYPEGIFGALIVRGCPNRPGATTLPDARQAVEARLRMRSNEAIDADPVAQAYAGYFRRYGARYPVVHQAKAVVAGRSIEAPSALVEAMFIAEVDSLVLTSGHDLDALSPPLLVDVAREDDVYTKLSGKEQRLKPRDMVVRDEAGVIACVLYGPDARTRLRSETRAALFGAWCPVGVPPSTVEGHLSTIAGLVQREWPETALGGPHILTAASRG